jgi:hypothetical protein
MNPEHVQVAIDMSILFGFPAVTAFSMVVLYHWFTKA